MGMNFTMLEIPVYAKYTFRNQKDRLIFGAYFAYILQGKFDIKVNKGFMMTDEGIYNGAIDDEPLNINFNDILDNWDCEKIVDPEIKAELEKRFGFVYPYEYRKDIPVKVSVSDLKKKSYHEDTDIEEAVYFEPDIVPLVPRFIEEKKETEEALGE